MMYRIEPRVVRGRLEAPGMQFTTYHVDKIFIVFVVRHFTEKVMKTTTLVKTLLECL